jgi:hypothetical protein
MLWPFRKKKKKQDESKELFSISLTTDDVLKVLVWKHKHKCNTKIVSKRKIWMRQERINDKKITLVKCDACAQVYHIT